MFKKRLGGLICNWNWLNFLQLLEFLQQWKYWYKGWPAAFSEPPAVTQVLAEAQEPGLPQPSTATAGQPLAKGHIWSGVTEHKTWMEMEYSLSCYFNNARRAPNTQQLSCKCCGASGTAAVKELWLYPHRQPQPAPQPWEQHTGTLHPSAAPGGTFPLPSSSSTASASSSAPQPSQLQQYSCLLSLQPWVWWLGNKKFTVFLKQVVHTKPEPFSQHLSLQTKLQRQAFSFLVCFFF